MSTLEEKYLIAEFPSHTTGDKNQPVRPYLVFSKHLLSSYYESMAEEGKKMNICQQYLLQETSILFHSWEPL